MQSFPAGSILRYCNLLRGLPHRVLSQQLQYNMPNKKESLEFANLILELVVDVRLKKILILVILGRHPLSLFLIALPPLRLTLLTKSLVQLQGLDVDVLVLQFRISNPGGRRRSQEASKGRPELLITDDHGDELVVKFGPVYQSAESAHFGLAALPVLLGIPQEIEKRCDYVFSNVLFIAADLNDIAGLLTPKKDQFFPSVLPHPPSDHLIVVQVRADTNVRHLQWSWGKINFNEICERDGVMGELYLQHLLDAIVAALRGKINEIISLHLEILLSADHLRPPQRQLQVRKGKDLRVLQCLGLVGYLQEHLIIINQNNSIIAQPGKSPPNTPQLFPAYFQNRREHHSPRQDRKGFFYARMLFQFLEV